MDNRSLFITLKNEIENSPGIRSMDYLNLLRQITNNDSFLPSMDDVGVIVGPDLIMTLKVLHDNCKWPDNNIHAKIRSDINKIDNFDLLNQEMTKWLKVNLQAHYSFEVRITLLENWINSKKIIINISDEIISDFEQRVASAHDWSLTKKDGGEHVTKLFNDGEINSTKSGHCYGERSIFISHHPLINYPKVKFPISIGNFSYVVLPEELALQFRTEMANMMKI